MAFGSGSRSFSPNAVLYSFAIKTKDLPAPIFHVSKKGADGKYHLLYKTDDKGQPLLDKEGAKVPLTATRVSGNIISASPKKGQHDGKDIYSTNLTIQDGDDVYFVSVPETFLGRNLSNSLLGLKATFDDIEIGLYQSKPKPGAVDKRGFASVALRQHNELVRGPYDPKKDMPQVKKVRVNGKDQSDTEQLDLWFREKMAAWCKVVNAAAPKQQAQPTSSAAPETHTDDEPTGGSEEVDPTAPPF